MMATLVKQKVPADMLEAYIKQTYIEDARSVSADAIMSVAKDVLLWPTSSDSGIMMYRI